MNQQRDMETSMHLRNSFSSRKILVTGASGFIGTHLCRRLQSLGGQVHAVSRTFHENSGDGFQWWQGDIGDYDTISGIFRQIKPDYIYHLASHVMGAPDLKHVLPTFRGNLQTSVNLLTAAAEYGCRRLVLTGSLAEPEMARGEMFPSAPYAAAKWASSAYGRMFHALYGVPVVLARVFMVYGPAQKDLTKLIPYVTLSFLRGQAPRISSGERLVDWIYISDVVEGFLAMCEAPGIEGSTLEIGSGTLVSIRKIVEQVAGLMGSPVGPAFGALPNRPLEPVRVADTASTYERIGWKPTISLTTGLQRTISWYREHLYELDTVAHS